MPKKPAEPSAEIRNRVKELRLIRGADLIANKKNWRKHPARQRDALKGVLQEIGYAGALLARETPEGFVLLDGHARAELTPDVEVPVLILDVNEREADTILATFDPIGAMAKMEEQQYEALLRDVQTGEEAVAEMLGDLAKRHKLLPSPETEGSAEGEGGESGSDAGEASVSPIPDKFAVVVECRSEAEQKEVYERLKGEGRECRLLTM